MDFQLQEHRFPGISGKVHRNIFPGFAVCVFFKQQCARLARCNIQRRHIHPKCHAVTVRLRRLLPLQGNRRFKTQRDRLRQRQRQFNAQGAHVAAKPRRVHEKRLMRIGQRPCAGTVHHRLGDRFRALPAGRQQDGRASERPGHHTMHRQTCKRPRPLRGNGYRLPGQQRFRTGYIGNVRANQQDGMDFQAHSFPLKQHAHMNGIPGIIRAPACNRRERHRK